DPLPRAGAGARVFPRRTQTALRTGGQLPCRRRARLRLLPAGAVGAVPLGSRRIRRADLVRRLAVKRSFPYAAAAHRKLTCRFPPSPHFPPSLRFTTANAS